MSKILSIKGSLIAEGNLNIPAYLSCLGKKSKKIISVYGLIAELNRCFFFNQHLSFYYYNRYITKLIIVFKQAFLITNFYLVAVKRTVLIPVSIIKNIYAIFLSVASVYVYNKTALAHIQLISKPRRIVFISYKRLRLLTASGTVATSYILNTTSGLILHHQALQQRQGGQLLCKIK